VDHWRGQDDFVDLASYSEFQCGVGDVEFRHFGEPYFAGAFSILVSLSIFEVMTFGLLDASSASVFVLDRETMKASCGPVQYSAHLFNHIGVE
jgi:hypothetical protein